MIAPLLPAVTLSLLLTLACGACAASGSASLEIADLTSAEMRDRVAAGARTVLLPIGGTEQNGAHMTLGKHNIRAHLLATRIARQLGNALVAPVIAYVPEGSIAPPSQHMRWPGTLSIPVAAFEGLLTGAAQSLRAHGFCHVVLLGDHGGYRASLDRVAMRLNGEWSRASTCRVHALPEYYRAASADFARDLQARGYKAAEIGIHAGLADTALMLATDARQVRADKLGGTADRDGVSGDPARATADLGRVGVEHIIEATVAAIRVAIQAGK